VTAPRAAQVQRLEDACELLPGATAPARGRGAADGREGPDEGAEGAVLVSATTLAAELERAGTPGRATRASSCGDTACPISTKGGAARPPLRSRLRDSL
jgi:hypothetical protein